MPEPILGPVLKALERLYTFRTAQRGAPDAMELSLPIQPVHNMDRLAAMGSPRGRQNGFWIGGGQHVHTIVGGLVTTPDPFAPAINTNEYPALVDARDESIWLYDCWMIQNDPADFVIGSLDHVQGSTSRGPWGAGVGAIIDKPLLYGTAVFNEFVTQTGTLNRWWPFRVLRNEGGGIGDSFLQFNTSAGVGGTLTVTMNYLFWLGPKGIIPPLGGG